jgi:hypothetical protein
VAAPRRFRPSPMHAGRGESAPSVDEGLCGHRPPSGGIAQRPMLRLRTLSCCFC